MVSVASDLVEDDAVGRWSGQFGAVLDELGVSLDGSGPCSMAVHDRRLAGRVARRGIVGLCDAYVDGWWDSDSIDELFARALRAEIPRRLWLNWPVLSGYVRELLNRQGVRRAARHGRRHYDLGNDLFEAMLDRRLTYSCAFWEGAGTLDQAQENKLELVCRKIGLEPGMRVLDIGCGWGSFVGYAAERYGAECVGVTVSARQVEYASARYALLPVEVRLQDYRAVRERFDRVVSIGMFEHVGARNYAAFMDVVRRCMAPGGLCLLHSFATQRGRPNLADTESVWVERNIFPGFVTPSVGQIGRALDGRLVVEDVHNFGADYDPTLMAWCANLEHARDRLRDAYGDRFLRMWRLYLLMSAGAFRSRKYQIFQWVLSARGVPGGYRRVRSVTTDAVPVVVARRSPTMAG